MHSVSIELIMEKDGRKLLRLSRLITRLSTLFSIVSFILFSRFLISVVPVLSLMHSLSLSLEISSMRSDSIYRSFNWCVLSRQFSPYVGISIKRNHLSLGEQLSLASIRFLECTETDQRENTQGFDHFIIFTK